MLEAIADMVKNVINRAAIVDYQPLLSFFLSQIRLLMRNPQQYRYDPELLILSFTWKMTSTALYKKLSNFFILPTARRLQQLSSGITVRPSQIDASYLSTRFSSLQGNDRVVILMMDEVYTAARIEYQSGDFVGMDEEGNVAKALLALMIKSLCANCKDVEALLPIKRLFSPVSQQCSPKVDLTWIKSTCSAC